MSKVALSSLFSKFRGKLGDLVILELNGQLIARRRPVRKAQRTPGEKAQNERMAKAAAYGKKVGADPEQRAFYAGLPHPPGVGYFQLAVRDFHHSPVVEDIDLSGYRGKVGDAVRITASDDTGVVEVMLQVSDMHGAPMESGPATFDEGTNRWTYKITRQVSSGQSVKIEATAKDRPGNKGAKSTVAVARG